MKDFGGRPALRADGSALSSGICDELIVAKSFWDDDDILWPLSPKMGFC